MQFDVTFRNLAPRDEVRQRGAALFKKLERFLDPAAEGHMVVSVEHHKAIVEILVTTRGNTFKAEEEEDDLRTAIDKLFHNIENQLRRDKNRRTDHRAMPHAEREEAAVAAQETD